MLKAKSARKVQDNSLSSRKPDSPRRPVSASDREGEREKKKKKRRRRRSKEARERWRRRGRVVHTHEWAKAHSYFRRGSLCIVRKMEMEPAIICV